MIVKRRIIRLIVLLIIISLAFPCDVLSRGGGGRGGGHGGGHGGGRGGHKGGHKSGKTGVSKGGIRGIHKGKSKIALSKSGTSVHYSRRGSKGKGAIPSRKFSSSYKYDNSVKRDKHGRIVRSEDSKKEFLRSNGYKSVPKGYEVDHIIPLYAGGNDAPSNMQLLRKEQHHAKTKADYERYGR